MPSLSDNPTHPAQIALRTYALSLSLSLGPSLIPFVTRLITAKTSSKNGMAALRRVLRRELGYDGFAFAFTLCVGGGAFVRQFWQSLVDRKETVSDDKRWSTLEMGRDLLVKFNAWSRAQYLSPAQVTFLSNVAPSSIGILLLQAGRERSSRLRRGAVPSASATTPFIPPVNPGIKSESATLDLTLLLLVRAVDSVLQALIVKRSLSTKEERPPVERRAAEHLLIREKLVKEKERRVNKRRQILTSYIDAMVFWACSARIMWCFFYEPQRLPRSYVKWINTLANVDRRLLHALNLIRNGSWSYINCVPENLGTLRSYAQDLGHPAEWGDPSVLPAYGGIDATMVWKNLGVTSRPGVGGLPCEVVHGNVGSRWGLSGSCTANTALRGLTAFLEATAIYLPAHFLPVLLTRPRTLFRPNRLLTTLFGALRSATFLSSFVALYWYSVCFTRSLALAKLFPFISHDFWDGPFGCMLAGSLMCGSSIWIENGRRRGEMALYVLPRAVRTCLPDTWVKNGSRSVRIAERIAFVLSLSTLLTAAIHRPDSLRGLSRWTVDFVINGPNAGFWKRKRRDPSIPPTPSVVSTPSNPQEN